MNWTILITSLVGISAPIIGILFKNYLSQRAVVSINPSFKEFFITSHEDSKAVPKENLKVSYKGKEYSHLGTFQCIFKNTSGEEQKAYQILFQIPKDIEVIEPLFSYNPVDYHIDLKEKNTPSGIELSGLPPKKWTHS